MGWPAGNANVYRHKSKGISSATICKASEVVRQSPIQTYKQYLRWYPKPDTAEASAWGVRRIHYVTGSAINTDFRIGVHISRSLCIMYRCFKLAKEQDGFICNRISLSHITDTRCIR